MSTRQAKVKADLGPKSKGYRNLIDRYKEARKVAMAAAALAPVESLAPQASGDIVLGVDLRVRRQHRNAVAAAIDHPFVPNTRVHSVRPPVKVPPNYLSRLKDLDTVRKKIETEEEAARAKAGESGLDKAWPIPGLKFDQRIYDRMRVSHYDPVRARSVYSAAPTPATPAMASGTPVPFSRGMSFADSMPPSSRASIVSDSADVLRASFIRHHPHMETMAIVEDLVGESEEGLDASDHDQTWDHQKWLNASIGQRMHDAHAGASDSGHPSISISQSHEQSQHGLHVQSFHGHGLMPPAPLFNINPPSPIDEEEPGRDLQLSVPHPNAAVRRSSIAPPDMRASRMESYRQNQNGSGSQLTTTWRHKMDSVLVRRRSVLPENAPHPGGSSTKGQPGGVPAIGAGGLGASHIGGGGGGLHLSAMGGANLRSSTLGPNDRFGSHMQEPGSNPLATDAANARNLAFMLKIWERAEGAAAADAATETQGHASTRQHAINVDAMIKRIDDSPSAANADGFQVAGSQEDPLFNPSDPAAADQAGNSRTAETATSEELAAKLQQLQEQQQQLKAKRAVSASRRLVSTSHTIRFLASVSKHVKDSMDESGPATGASTQRRQFQQQLMPSSLAQSHEPQSSHGDEDELHDDLGTDAPGSPNSKAARRGTISHSTYRFLKRLSLIEPAANEDSERALQTVSAASVREDPLTMSRAMLDGRDAQQQHHHQPAAGHKGAGTAHADASKHALVPHPPQHRRATMTDSMPYDAMGDHERPTSQAQAGRPPKPRTQHRRIEIMALVNENMYPFHLQLPPGDIDDFSTDAGSIAGDQTAHHAAQIHEDALNRAASAAHDRRRHIGTGDTDVDDFGVPIRSDRATLREIFGKQIIIPHGQKGPLDWGSIFRPIKLRDTLGKAPPDPLPPPPPKFSLERFVSLVKITTHHHPPERKPDVDPVQEYRKNPLPINTLIDFLETPLTALAAIPQPGTPERRAVIKSLTLGLREETDRLLQFESCRLIIALGAQGDLGRWDTFIFKGVMADMLEQGRSDDERDAAALTFLAAGTVNPTVVNQIRTGLGHLDEDRRATSVRVLGAVHANHADIIVPIMLEDSKHTSWRVRIDVVRLLRVWIEKLSPPAGKPAATRDPDALDTDDDELIKALFHTLGTTTNDKDRDDEMAGIALSLSVGLGDMDLSHASDIRLPTADGGSGMGGRRASGSLPSMYAPGHALHAALGMSMSATAASVAASMSPATPAVLEQREKVVRNCVDVLLNMMWTDWNKDVRDEASAVLGELRQGRPIFEWVVRLLDSTDPVKRVDALRCLTYLAVMTKEALGTYLKCFKDSYASVRIEACKVACTLGSADRGIVNALLDLLDDHDYRVRAYAIKALGYTQCKEPKNRETLNWALHHDHHPVVRAEAIRAVANLNLIMDDQTIREGVFTLLETDKSDKVKKEAERVLVANGLIFSGLIDGDANGDKKEVTVINSGNGAGVGGAGMSGMPSQLAGGNGGNLASGTTGSPADGSGGGPSNATRITTHSLGPYPHILTGATAEQVEIFLRESLIGDKELSAAINQVRELATKDSIMAEVQYVLKTSDDPIDLGLDLQIDAEFMPMISDEHRAKSAHAKHKIDSRMK
ncbi:hypothetical protein BC831DRAFT_463585 [Entophlyctis helioformis]|nr:hypothetical protein BC831DRAFT_463585 [Entophlyctis helioformis]